MKSFFIIVLFFFSTSGQSIAQSTARKVRRDDIDLIKRLHARATESAKTAVLEDYKRTPSDPGPSAGREPRG